MAKPFQIVVDSTAILAALGHVTPAMYANLKEASKVTADAIATEAKNRIRRRTGQTGDAITVQETYKRDGYVVLVGPARRHIGYWLEYGTKKMRPYPFLFASAELEKSNHERRCLVAVQAAIGAQGLGPR